MFMYSVQIHIFKYVTIYHYVQLKMVNKRCWSTRYVTIKACVPYMNFMLACRKCFTSNLNVCLAQDHAFGVATLPSVTTDGKGRVSMCSAPVDSSLCWQP
jgi:hypothetical protein